MSKFHSLPYRGQFVGLVGRGAELLFCTRHPEGLPTGLYWLDLEKLNLGHLPIANPVDACCAIDEDIFIAAGTELLKVTKARKSAKGYGDALPATASSLSPLAGGRIVALCGPQALIIDAKSGKVAQTLEFEQPLTAVDADPTGAWLALGDRSGTVRVFQAEEQSEFVLSDAQPLHSDEVTAILFERDDLRFYSAGRDRKLLSTHARGTLEAEDRGRSGMHDAPVAQLLWGTEDRFLSVSEDKTAKSWERGSNRQPATFKDGLVAVSAAAVVTLHKKVHLVCGCDDASLRLVRLDKDGKFDELTATIRDVYTHVSETFTSSETDRREDGLRTLAELADAKALERLADRATRDESPSLRVLAANLLGESDHADTTDRLTPLLKAREPAVREAAFDALVRRVDPSDLDFFKGVVSSNFPEIGAKAVREVGRLAKSDDQAYTVLLSALDSKQGPIGRAVLQELEALTDADSPNASLAAYASNQASLRELALQRLGQRELLEHPQSKALLRKAVDDRNADVRRTACLLVIASRVKLANALRSRDEQVHRQLAELDAAPDLATLIESDGHSASDGKSKAAKDRKLPKQPTAKKNDLPLSTEDLEPLLQLMSARAVDSALRGAKGLATLGDPRCFGMLLQLSRESDPAARTEAAVALGRLEDPRGLQRLTGLLSDSATEVRDAAFSALESQAKGETLGLVERVFRSGDPSVRGRGLSLLVEFLKSKPKKSGAAHGQELLAEALDDSAADVRLEAAKAARNLPAKESKAETLRFIAGSAHEDVRGRVLTEAVGEKRAEWSTELLTDFLSDPATALRRQAFQTLMERAEKKDIAPYRAAIASPHVDVRLQTVKRIAQKQPTGGQELLTEVISDPEADIRKAALDVLIAASSAEPLRVAMRSKQDDVRLYAAIARAKYGDPDAFDVLSEFATRTFPRTGSDAEKQAWKEQVGQSLRGLGELGDPRAVPVCESLLESQTAAIRVAAMATLIWVVPEDERQLLRRLLSHSEDAIKYRAALALAYRGDASVASLVFGPAREKTLSIELLLLAAWQLGAGGESRLIGFLDHESEPIAIAAFRLLMFRESVYGPPSESPSRCVAAMASTRSRIRLLAADGLVASASMESMSEFLLRLVNERPGEDRDWKLSATILEEVVALSVAAPPLVRARAAKRVSLLGQANETAWRPVWKPVRERFSEELQQAQSVVESAADHERPEAEIVGDLVFGTYVGLSREQLSGDHDGTRDSSIRQQAIRRLTRLADDDDSRVASVVPVLEQALGDSNSDVRFLAFDSLLKIGDASRLATAAMESGMADIETRGLELLTREVDEDEAVATLVRLMQNRTDALGLRAAHLLLTRVDRLSVAKDALASRNPQVAAEGLRVAIEDFGVSDAALGIVRDALGHRVRFLQWTAARALVRRRDSAAYPWLIETVKPSGRGDRLGEAFLLLGQLADARTPKAVVDVLSGELPASYPARQALTLVGTFRDPDVVDELISILRSEAERPEGRRQSDVINGAAEALMNISGFDQSTPYPEDDPHAQPTRAEVADALDDHTHPLRPEVLVRLMRAAWESELTGIITRFGSHTLHWPDGPSAELDETLARMFSSSDERLRNRAVFLYGWRLRYRDADPDPLLDLLDAKDADLKFEAAKHLAYAGRGEGLSILLAGLDLMPDLEQRTSAVRALGFLADPRAVGTLLRIAEEDGHALQEPALEAIGHFNETPEAEAIFARLKSFAAGSDGLAVGAWRGLAAYDTSEAWETLRSRAEDDSNWNRSVIYGLLSRSSRAENHEVIRSVLRDGGHYMSLEAAYFACREISEDDPYAADYLILQNPTQHYLQWQASERIAENPDSDRLLAVLPHTSDHQERLRDLLLSSPSPSAGPITAALASNDPTVVAVAATLAGRQHSESKSVREAVEKMIEKWLGFVSDPEFRSSVLRLNPNIDSMRMLVYSPHRMRAADRKQALNGVLGDTLAALVSAGVACGTPTARLIEVSQSLPDDSVFSSVRTAVLRGLTDREGKDVDEFLTTQAREGDPDARSLAVRSLAKTAGRIDADLAGGLLDDGPRLAIALAHDVPEAETLVSEHAADARYQPVLLPELIGHSAVDELRSVAADAANSEVARLGAVEALGRVASEDGEAALVSLGTDEGNPTPIRKAAWRARLRSLRARTNS